jgi:hypothetical protein
MFHYRNLDACAPPAPPDPAPALALLSVSAAARGELHLVLLLCHAPTKMQLTTISGCKVYESLCPLLMQLLVYAKSLIDSVQIPIGVCASA